MDQIHSFSSAIPSTQQPLGTGSSGGRDGAWARVASVGGVLRGPEACSSEGAPEPVTGRKERLPKEVKKDPSQ